MSVIATVRVWHDQDGWGVLDCPETPGGCWAHVSSVEMPGYRSLAAGAPVLMTWEGARQDGYRCRAVRCQPLDGAVSGDPRTAANTPAAAAASSYTSSADWFIAPGSEAYRSCLTVSFDTHTDTDTDTEEVPPAVEALGLVPTGAPGT